MCASMARRRNSAMPDRTWREYDEHFVLPIVLSPLLRFTISTTLNISVTIIGAEPNDGSSNIISFGKDIRPLAIATILLFTSGKRAGRLLDSLPESRKDVVKPF